MKKNYTQAIMKAKYGIAYYCSFFLLCIVPLYFEDAYFNILQAKYHAFVFCEATSLAAALVVMLVDRKQTAMRFSWYDFVLFAFGIVSILSSVLSNSPVDALTGRKGWLIGGFTIIALLLIFRLISCWMEYKESLLLCVWGVNSLIFIVGILYSFGVDAWYMHKEIFPGFESLYFSTIGHVNWLSGYLCLLLPMFLIFYLKSSGVPKYLYLMLLILGIIVIVLRSSDSVYIGLGFGTMFAIPYILRNKERRRRTGILFVVYGCAAIVMRSNPALQNTELEGLKSLLTSYQISIVLIALGIVEFIADLCISSENEKSIHILIVVAEIIMLTIVATCFVNTILNFSDSWGTGRGRIWKRSIEVFENFSARNKLIGIGPEMLAPFYKGLFSDMPLLVSHSEPIQILLTLGIWGIACWCVLWSGFFLIYFRRKLWQKDSMAFFLPLAAYFGQSFFNSAMITNLAVLCVIAAIFFNMEEKEKYAI